MAAFDLDGWLKQHGGEAEAVPLQQGDVEHRAQDGSYVVIRRDGTSAMVGFRPPGESSPQPAAPSAVQPPGGSGMDKQALEALLAQIAPNGDPLRLVYTQTTKPVKVTVPGEGLTDKPTTKTVNLLVHQWVDPVTGQVLVAEQGQDGTYTVTKQGIDQSAVGKPAVTPEQQAADQGGKVKKPVPNKPGVYEVTTKDPLTNVTETHYEDEGGNRVAAPSDSGTVKKPVPGRPDVFEVTTKDAATNATETHYEDANGNRVPTPTAPGASARKPVPGKPGVYEVTTANPTTGVTETHYEDDSGNRVPTPTEPPKSNRKPVPNRPGIYEVTNANPTTGVTETHYEDESGARVATPSEAAPTTSMSRPGGPVGPVTDWLQAETEKLAKQAAEENWTRERFDAEVKRRLDFAHQLVAENTATQAQENATADRVAANQRQAMSTSGGIATSIAPGMIKQGGEFLPGNGRVATEGLMAMLGMLGQYTQRASQQAGNAAGRTTISPDGTITVQHVPAGSAPPAQPAQDQADAAVRHAQAAAGVNTLGSAGTDPVFRPAPPTDVQPAAAGPDFTDPTTGQFGIPGSFSTGPYGAVPDWMQQQATQAAAPSGGDANEYLGMVGQDDPSWQAALAEANRRREMSMAGAA